MAKSCARRPDCDEHLPTEICFLLRFLLFMNMHANARKTRRKCHCENSTIENKVTLFTQVICRQLLLRLVPSIIELVAVADSNRSRMCVHVCLCHSKRNDKCQLLNKHIRAINKIHNRNLCVHSESERTSSSFALTIMQHPYGHAYSLNVCVRVHYVSRVFITLVHYSFQFHSFLFAVHSPARQNGTHTHTRTHNARCVRYHVRGIAASERKTVSLLRLCDLIGIGRVFRSSPVLLALRFSADTVLHFAMNCG